MDGGIGGVVFAILERSTKAGFAVNRAKSSGSRPRR
jgi:hypothetical protein